MLETAITGLQLAWLPLLFEPVMYYWGLQQPTGEPKTALR